MRAAILISGYLRTFKFNLDNILHRTISNFNEIDVYIHLTTDEELNDKYLNAHRTSDDIKLIRKKLNPICLICEPNLDTSSDTIENNIINNWIKYFKLNQIKKCNEEIYGKYDLVIKYRPDLHIFSKEIGNFDLIDNVVYLPKDAKIDIKKLKHKNDKYVCDMLAYGNSATMDKYFSIYQSIKSLIEQYGTASETLLYNYLKKSKIKHKLVDIDYGVILSSCNVFAICGDSGSGKTTLSNILKKYFNNSFLLECDRYHKWERHDENWNKFTHLNPDANYLTKIQDDVFNLKLGHAVYQVNYDHNSGKFTGEEEINPANNIIVCGLHSLYGNNDQIYDFKIFMDTEEKLKLKWKVARDTTERGHNKDSVIEQINKRKTDFQKFIYPQREKSDMIVNFYIQDDSTETSLKLLVNNQYDVSNIIKELDTTNIEYTTEDNGGFITFIFKQYQPLKRWGHYGVPSTNDFYDYIIMFIFKLKKLK